jgi:hypothetical protein
LIHQISLARSFIPPQIIRARMTAQLDADFVAFLIRMRGNKWWKFWK